MTRSNALAALLIVAASTAGAGCAGTAYPHDTGKTAPGTAAPPPVNAVSRWTPRLEVYVVYGPLVAGKPTEFAVHVTDLQTFKPLAAGRVGLEFATANGRPVQVRIDSPAEPGEFPIEVTLPAAATYRARVTVGAPGGDETVELGEITAFGTLDAATHALPSPGTGVVFAKARQWERGLATATLNEATVRGTVRATAVIRAASGGEAVVSAPSPGRFTGTVPPLGSRVAEGQPLGQLEPRLENLDDVTTLEAEVAKLRLEVVEARNELARADLLVTARAVPARRFETARHDLDNARSDLRAAEARLESRLETLAQGGSAAGRNAFVLRAPLAGTLAAIDATPGASYEAGASLFRIVRTDPVLVEVQVPEGDAAAAIDVRDASIEIAAGAEPIALDIRAVRHAGRIDPETRALPVWLEVANRGQRLLLGQTVRALLHTGDRTQALAVPASAVVTDGGRSVVFVQTGGETFERRLVQAGARDGGLVAITAGLLPGDRVVTRGAYDVLLAAAMPARAADGHVH